jgi:hypothetical protein
MKALPADYSNGKEVRNPVNSFLSFLLTLFKTYYFFRRKE